MVFQGGRRDKAREKTLKKETIQGWFGDILYLRAYLLEPMTFRTQSCNLQSPEEANSSLSKALSDLERLLVQWALSKVDLLSLMVTPSARIRSTALCNHWGQVPKNIQSSR